MPITKPKVINVHHVGSVETLPSNCVYVGRPSPYGNSHSSKSGDYSREDCVGFHRVDLYAALIEDPTYLATLRKELGGRDLACWCKQPHKLCACHADNYLHVLSEELQDRTYDKTVWFYLLDDLKTAMRKINDLIDAIPMETDNLFMWIGYGDLKIDVTELLRLFEERDTDFYLRCIWLSTVIIDLEMMLQETSKSHQLYRLDHCTWNCFRFSYRPTSRAEEPSPPDVKIRKPPRKKKELVDEPTGTGS